MIPVDPMGTAMSAALFIEFVEVVFNGNRSEAARALGVDKSTVTKICKEDRGITPEMAKRCEELSSGRYARARFIWPEQDDGSQSPMRGTGTDLDAAA